MSHDPPHSATADPPFPPQDSGWLAAERAIRACLDAGVGEFVVCGGARNALLLERLARLEQRGVVRVWSHFEERSAGFFALGRTMATAKPCAVVTTSGTAAAELLPAVVEAFHQARPLVAITADRPDAARGSGAPQTIDQRAIYGPHAFNGAPAAWTGRLPLHCNVALPEAIDIPDDDGAESRPGEEVATFSPAWEKPNVAALARWLREPGLRGMVVAVGGLDPEEREEVWHFCKALEVPVVAEATSGLREALVALQLPDADRLLRRKPPSKVLRLGDCPSGRFWRDLETDPEVAVWSVCRNGLRGLARAGEVTTGPVHRVLRALGEIEPIGDVNDHLVTCGRDAARIDELLEAHPDSEPAMIRALSRYALLAGPVFLGNSLPVREWNLFAQWQAPVTQVRANRGANGIDGQLSTWLGTTAEDARAWAFVGDLTALYDPAAAALLGQVERRHRVLAVINNHGGRIFERLPRLATMSHRARDWLVHPQKADFAAFAALWGMRHHRIATLDNLDRFDPEVPDATLLEVTPSAAETEAFWRAWDTLD